MWKLLAAVVVFGVAGAWRRSVASVAAVTANQRLDEFFAQGGTITGPVTVTGGLDLAGSDLDNVGRINRGGRPVDVYGAVNLHGQNLNLQSGQVVP